MEYVFAYHGGATGQNYTIEADSHREAWDKTIEYFSNKPLFGLTRGIYCKKYRINKDAEWIDSGFVKNVATFHHHDYAQKLNKEGKDFEKYLKTIEELENTPRRFDDIISYIKYHNEKKEN